MDFMDSLSVTCICPSCFKKIYLAECNIVSGIVSGQVLKKAHKGPLARVRGVEPLVGPRYTQELARRQCYNCDYLLPRNIERVPGLAIVVVGDLSSGKSSYIASLIHQIKTDWMRNASGYARFICLTPDVETDYIQNYFNRLFIDKQAIGATQQAVNSIRKPLIYNLAVARSAKHLPTEINLMIYDASGEDFANAYRLVDVARFVFETRAFIFVVDPWTVTSIFSQLPANLKTALQPNFQRMQGLRAATRLNDTIAVVEQYRGLASGSRFSDTPVAVMVSKADLFKHLNLGTRRFMINPQYGSGIDLQDIDAVDQEVRELLRDYGQGDLLAATARFSHVKFFATSATGEPPDQFDNFTNVEPCRCLDPILWILHALSVI